MTLPSAGPAGDATPGVLILSNNPEETTLPQVRGRPITLGGVLRSTGGRGEVQTDLITLPASEIDVQTAAELSLEGAVTYAGPNVHGPGTLVQNGDASVVSSTTIATNVFDWDGDSGGPSSTTIRPAAALTINSSQIETGPVAADGYDGHVTVGDGGALIVNTTGPWRLDGTMTLAGQPIASPNVIVDGSDLTNYGTIEGNGRIQSSLVNHGTLSPGQSAGALRFLAGFTLASDGVVEIELGGLAPFSQYDRIVVNQFGTANLAGGLEVSLLDGFVPKDGDKFTILTAGVVSGSFNDAAVAGVNLPSGVTFNVVYGMSDVTLAFAVDYPADFNMDGVVDDKDLSIWEGSYGIDAGGDADGDDDTDGADFLIWQQQLGSGQSGSATTAPQPATALLLMAAATGCVFASCRATGAIQY